MIAREWTNVDKAAWGDGPWQEEPDKVQWVDPATDLDCLMVRAPMTGAWCGYVGVPPGHPAHGKDYQSVDVVAHGGLTYADTCQEDAVEGFGVCHIPLPGREPDVWWLGFDCAHAFDLAPAHRARMRERDLPAHLLDSMAVTEVYRDRTYVAMVVETLAAQLHAMAGPPSI